MGLGYTLLHMPSFYRTVKRSARICKSPDVYKKVIFKLDVEDGYPPVGYESVWAIEKEGLYTIENIPFFARDVTIDDVVSVIEVDGELFYGLTVVPAQNSLIRVIYYTGTDPFDISDRLSLLGCDTEIDSNRHIIAVNIPITTPLANVCDFLREGFLQDLWDYEEVILRQ